MNRNARQKAVHLKISFFFIFVSPYFIFKVLLLFFLFCDVQTFKPVTFHLLSE
jgi:hypothetical protein